MFDDEKIKLIRSLPEGNTIIIVWIQLLSVAGKTNDDGMIYIGRNLAYSDEMLSTIFDHPLSTIRLALRTLEDFELIETNPDGIIRISNWEKHQNVEGMEHVRKLNAERNKRYRERKKQQLIEQEKERDVSVTSRDATEKIREDKNRLEKNREDNDKDKHDIVVNPLQFYESSGFGTIAPMIVEQVDDWVKEFEQAGNTKEEANILIIKAMEFGVIANARNWRYVNKILTNWKQRGLVTMDKIEAAEAQRNEKLAANKAKPSYSKSPVRKESLPDWADETKPKGIDRELSEKEQAAFQERLQKIRAQREG